MTTGNNRALWLYQYKSSTQYLQTELTEASSLDPKHFISRTPKLIPYFIKSFNPLLFGKSAINFMVCYKVVQFYGNSDFAIFHCQFGPNGLIAAWLKELGLLSGKIITTFHGYDAHSRDPNFRRIYSIQALEFGTLVFRHSDWSP